MKEFGADRMPQTADNLARDFQIAREDCVAYASSRSTTAANADGFFADEITAVTIPRRRASRTSFTEDEHPRPRRHSRPREAEAAVRTDGVVTAGNASGINDGAVALLIASRDAGDKARRPSRCARIIPSGVAGVAPRMMGFGPVPAAKKALERAGLTIKDMDVIEINEAFAAQVLACLKGLDCRRRRTARQSERRRDRARPSARRLGRSHRH